MNAYKDTRQAQSFYLITLAQLTVGQTHSSKLASRAHNILQKEKCMKIA